MRLMRTEPTDRPTIASAFEAMLAFLHFLVGHVIEGETSAAHVGHMAGAQVSTAMVRGRAAVDEVRLDARVFELISLVKEASLAFAETRPPLPLPMAVRLAAERPTLTEEEARAWGSKLAQAQSHAPIIAALLAASRGEVPAWVRPSGALAPSPAARRAAGETGHGMVERARWQADALPDHAGGPDVTDGATGDAIDRVPEHLRDFVRSEADAAHVAARIRVGRDALRDGRSDVEQIRRLAEAAGALAFAAVVERHALVDTAKGRRETATDYPDDKRALIADLTGETAEGRDAWCKLHGGEPVAHPSEPAFDRLERAVATAARSCHAGCEVPWCIELRAALAAFTTARAAVDEPAPRPVAEVEAQATSYEAGLADGAALIPGSATWERFVKGLVAERDSLKKRVEALRGALIHVRALNPFAIKRVANAALAADDKAAS